MESYKIQNAKMTKKTGRVSFDFVDGHFRLSVSGSWTEDPFTVTVVPVKITFMGEAIFDIDGSGPHGMRPVFRTQSYVVPLCMLDKFTKMLRNTWCKQEGKTMSQTAIDKFTAGLRKDKPRGYKSKCPCDDPENHNEPWCIRCELKMKH